jgi:ubiquinone/menaquinone biosynthesis C-methylase UbiE
MTRNLILTEYVNCDLCGGENTRLLYKMPDIRFWVTDQEFCVVACINCGHQYLNPRPTAASLAKCYPMEYYELRGQNIPKQRNRYYRQAAYFNGKVPGRFLDIGCAQGAFCEAMMGKGWECYGMDFIDQTKAVLPEKLKYHSASLENINYQDDYFDGVSAWGVFEHLISPKSYFIEVARILKPGGLFVCLVPNSRSLWSRFSYKEDIPRHMHFFLPKSIKKYAEIAKLRIISKDFTNSIYSRPATGRDCFRINFLKWIGVPWSKINHRQTELHLKLISILGALMGRLIHPRIEEILRISGTMVIQFTKD